MSDFLAYTSPKANCNISGESLNLGTSLFNLNAQEDFNEINKPSTSQRESPAVISFNFDKLASSGKQISGPAYVNTPRLKQNWIFTMGYGVKITANNGLMIRCAVEGCTKIYRSVNGSTSSIRNHLKKKHNISGPADSISTLGTPTPIPAVTPLTLQSQKASSPVHLRLVTSGQPYSKQEMPFSQVLTEKPKDAYASLETFGENRIPLAVLQDTRLLRIIGASQTLNPHVNVSVMSGDAPEDASPQIQLYKAKIKDMLRRQIGVSLTLGRWRNERGHHQIVVAAHFIDNDWKLKEMVVAILDLASSFKTELARQLLNVVEEYEMGMPLHTITSDYGVDVCAVVQEFAKLCIAKNIPFDCIEHHVPCLGFIINTTVNSVLQAGLGSPQTDPSGSQYKPISINFHLDKFRMGIKAIRDNVERLAHFETSLLKYHLKFRELVLDVSNQWDTTYAMVETLLEVHQAYNDACYGIELGKFMITSEDLEFLEELKNFLGPFHAFSIRISSSRYPTIHRAVVMFDKLIAYFSLAAPKKEPFFQQAYFYIIHSFKQHFTKATSFPIYPIASVMDPRLKYSFWKPPTYSSEDRDRLIGMVTSYWDKHYNVFEEAHHLAQFPPSSFDNIFEMEPVSSSDDFKRYIQEPVITSSFVSDASVWDYWRQSAHSFPQLSKMARKFLCIPVTSLPCEHQLVHSGKYALSSLSKGISPSISNDLCLLLSWKRVLG